MNAADTGFVLMTSAAESSDFKPHRNPETLIAGLHRESVTELPDHVDSPFLCLTHWWDQEK